MAEIGVKRKDCEVNGDDSDDEWVGPLPSEASQPKKKKCQSILKAVAAVARVRIPIAMPLITVCVRTGIPTL